MSDAAFLGIARLEFDPVRDRRSRRHPSSVKRQLQLPQGEGTDRAEGFTLLADSAGTKDVLVVFDSPANVRQTSESAISADVYRLP